jgi:hypothetical protein
MSWVGVAVAVAVPVAITILILILPVPRSVLHWITRRSGGAVVYRVPQLTLTIDGGPSFWTDDLLRVLRGRPPLVPAQRAIFFVTHERVAMQPYMVYQTVKDGHRLGVGGNFNSYHPLVARNRIHTTEHSIADALGEDQVRIPVASSASSLDERNAAPPEERDLSPQKPEREREPMCWMRPSNLFITWTILRAGEKSGYKVLLSDIFSRPWLIQHCTTFMKWFYWFRIQCGSTVVTLYDGSAELVETSAEVLRFLNSRDIYFSA